MATNRNRMITGIIVMMTLSFWFQLGGTGMVSLISSDDITLRQAVCEVVSMVNLAGALVLIALLPNKKEIV